MSSRKISIRGAREHNLKDISLDIPRDKFVVLTGLSGSGKSSLAFDTIYAEGQRRYLESLSAYARQFMEQMKKPAVNAIDGLSPSISIEQKNISKNPRSTVGTITEIYDYLRLLYARVGIPHCPSCGKAIQSQTPQQIVDQILAYPQNTKFAVLAPIVRAKKGEYRKELSELSRQGFARARIDGEDVELGGSIQLRKNLKHDISIYIDRLVLKPAILSRLNEAVEMAMGLSEGLVEVIVSDIPGSRFFSTQFACVDCGTSFSEMEPRSFSFNSPQGYCERCSGLGQEYVFDVDKIVPDPRLSLLEGAIAPWRTKSTSWVKKVVVPLAEKFKFNPDTAFGSLPNATKDLILTGSSEKVSFEGFSQSFEGVIPVLQRQLSEATSYGESSGVEEFLSLRPCEACHGARLKPQALSVMVGGKNIYEACSLSIVECHSHFKNLNLDKSGTIIAKPIMKEVLSRLDFLNNVGLEYLTLARTAATLSGGEAQRIRLATQIGSHLVGVLYVLDEPSIGLHQRDNEKLILTLEKLRDLGNSVLVVEHDEETIRRADHLIDMGPGAGVHGGYITYEGPPGDISKSTDSLTAKYLSGERKIASPEKFRPADSKKVLRLVGAHQNNLKNITVDFPLGNFICVTGVSGSGKSTLIIDTLLPALEGFTLRQKKPVQKVQKIEGLELIDKVIHVDQSPIGRTPRSNPATYTGTFTDIRALFTSLPESRMRGYKPSRFSFNVPGGRCEACRGDGNIRITMHFLPDVFVPCEVCRGRRYNRETLQVHFRGKNIADVLEMPIEEAAQFFEKIPKLRVKFQTLNAVGLGYVHVGQSAVTLSGGEAQRVKLSKELVRRATGKTVYILDEPTTGLHFADIEKLMDILHQLVDQGNTVVVIEHHMDVIKQADHIIDLGPEAGIGGGEVVYQGPLAGFLEAPKTHTGQFLKKALARENELSGLSARKKSKHRNIDREAISGERKG